METLEFLPVGQSVDGLGGQPQSVAGVWSKGSGAEDCTFNPVKSDTNTRRLASDLYYSWGWCQNTNK